MRLARPRWWQSTVARRKTEARAGSVPWVRHDASVVVLTRGAVERGPEQAVEVRQVVEAGAEGDGGDERLALCDALLLQSLAGAGQALLQQVFGRGDVQSGEGPLQLAAG